MCFSSGSIYQAGTLSGNPLAVTAGLATINILIKLAKDGFYEELEEKTKIFSNDLNKRAKAEGINIRINQIGSMMTAFFTEKEVYNYETAKKSSEEKYAMYFWKMLKNGIYLPPSQYETMFISAAHNKKDLQKALNASSIAFREIKNRN